VPELCDVESGASTDERGPEQARFVLLDGVGERRLDATHAGERSAARVGQDRGQRELCGASRVEAPWRPPRLRPRRPQALLRLASVGQAVLDLEDVSALALADAHMAADAVRIGPQLTYPAGGVKV
jgi:hypothetical protein